MIQGMRASFLAVLLLVASSSALAQRSLEDLKKTFVAERQALGRGERPSPEAQRELMQKQAGALAKFVADEARGDDRWNGRLMLCDLWLLLGNRKSAEAVLVGLDPEQAPPLLLLAGATMAERMRLGDQRKALVSAALAKPAPLLERLAMARILMTMLREVEAGEQIFKDALAAAADDAAKAEIRWHYCDALRDREDLPDNAAYDELEKLAKDLPGTYWGSVARDRLLATRFTIGGPPLPIAGKATDGQEVSLQALAGKVVLVCFWSAFDPTAKDLATLVAQLQQEHGAAFGALGVSFDPDPAAFAAECKALGVNFPQLCDGRGTQTDVALRWHVEGPALFVVGKDGKFAGLGLTVGMQSSRRELVEIVGTAVRAGG
jgi:peroxiredoxin